MSHPEPPIVAAAGRARSAARLRAAVHSTLLQGRELSHLRPHLSDQIRPLLRRLEEIRRELGALQGLRGDPLPPETTPIWID